MEKNIALHYNSEDSALHFLPYYANKVEEDVWILKRANGKEFSFVTLKDLIEHKLPYIVGYFKYTKRNKLLINLQKFLQKNRINPLIITNNKEKITITDSNYTVYELSITKTYKKCGEDPENE